MLLLAGCATGPRARPVKFIGTEPVDGEKSPHVCIVQENGALECITLGQFLRLVSEAKPKAEEQGFDL